VGWLQIGLESVKYKDSRSGCVQQHIEQGRLTINGDDDENDRVDAAMEQESQALRRLMQGWKRIQVGKYRGFQLELSDQTWVLVTSGMGLRRAREAAQTLVEAVSPQMLVSFGIAGAVETTLNIGDVIQLRGGLSPGW